MKRNLFLPLLGVGLMMSVLISVPGCKTGNKGQEDGVEISEALRKNVLEAFNSSLGKEKKATSVRVVRTENITDPSSAFATVYICEAKHEDGSSTAFCFIGGENDSVLRLKPYKDMTHADLKKMLFSL